MRFLSCFSGIEAASVAWTPLGWTCVGVAEVEPFPCAVLAHDYPDVPNLGDVTADDFLQRASALRPDVLVGGPPCQDFSVAGLRAGLGGDRGNLSLRWVEIVRAIRPAFAVTENVPGWLSVNEGHAFGAFLSGLVGHDTALIPPRECGGRWTNAGMVDGPLGRVAWRILDAQYFALAQRRQRVFAVFCPRDGADPAKVLFEPASLRWDSPPRREAGEGASGALEASLDRSRGAGTPTAAIQAVANPLGAKRDGGWRGDLDNDTYAVVPLQEIGKRTGVSTDDPRAGIGIGQGGDPMFTLQAGAQHGVAVAFDLAQITSATNRTRAEPGLPASTLNGSGDMHVATRAAVRRLTPTECARLQGFPDDWLDITFRGRPAADGNKYRALGNSMAVPVVRWLGERIAAQEAEIKARERAAA